MSEIFHFSEIKENTSGMMTSAGDVTRPCSSQIDFQSANWREIERIDLAREMEDLKANVGVAEN